MLGSKPERLINTDYGVFQGSVFVAKEWIYKYNSTVLFRVCICVDCFELV